MPDRDRTETVLLVLVWVLPLLAAAALLAAAGLPLLAGALLAVEVVVALSVYAATRRPQRASAASRPWLVPAAMVAVLAVLLGVTLLAASLG